jgi:hypothetical protein
MVYSNKTVVFFRKTILNKIQKIKLKNEKLLLLLLFVPLISSAPKDLLKKAIDKATAITVQIQFRYCCWTKKL